MSPGHCCRQHINNYVIISSSQSFQLGRVLLCWWVMLMGCKWCASHDVAQFVGWRRLALQLAGWKMLHKIVWHDNCNRSRRYECKFRMSWCACSRPCRSEVWTPDASHSSAALMIEGDATQPCQYWLWAMQLIAVVVAARYYSNHYNLYNDKLLMKCPLN